jgi:hypothetical protein
MYVCVYESAAEFLGGLAFVLFLLTAHCVVRWLAYLFLSLYPYIYSLSFSFFASPGLVVKVLFHDRVPYLVICIKQIIVSAGQHP